MKRRAENQTEEGRATKRKAKSPISPGEAAMRFRDGLFDKKVLERYISEYKQSSPYKHCVIHGLINDQLLRDVRDEIKENVNFTPKETDIYKIHQSGDLANLDGLDDESLSKLPSLVKLRDALYSQTFRDYVSSITGSGPLSERKRDLAINVYTPGGFLLCHDDVIGTRKVSFILYLVDPDIPWKPEWGGALRLYPVRQRTGKDGVVARTPGPDHCKSIPPTWNQLSFFEVQPGESFHDVEEVYHPESDQDLEKDGGRVRMAISGWFHIPQLGEDGYVEGAAEAHEKNSGLAQLQGKPDRYDLPQPNIVAAKPLENEFTQEDLSYLAKYINPQYLIPDVVEEMVAAFNDASSLTLANFLNTKFAGQLKDYITRHEESGSPKAPGEIEKGPWKLAQPPHKHRYLYIQPGEDASTEESPLQELVENIIPSDQFQKWLQSVTSSKILTRDLLVRRFRRGMDYTLSTGYEGNPRLELSLCLTPTPGWGADAELDDEEEDEEDEDEEREEDEEEEDEEEGSKARTSEVRGKSKGKAKVEENGSLSKPINGTQVNGNNDGDAKGEAEVDENKSESNSSSDESDDLDVGGQEIYMAGDDDEEEDAAVYKSSADDSILFFQSASWNTLTLVLRDGGALKFTKYVSRAAKGDRWDISGSFDVEMEDEDEEEEDEGELRGVQDDSEEEFQGFSDHKDTDSDSD